MSTIPFARRVAAIAAASIESSKSIVPTTAERFAGSATNGVACSARLGPAVEVRRRGPRAPDAPLEPARAEHPLELVGEQQQGGDRRGVVGLVLARVLERRRQRERGRLPAPVGAVELADPLDRGRAQQRKPEARRRSRRPSAGRSSTRPPAPGRARARRRRRWRRSGPGRRRRRRGGEPGPRPRSRSRCGPRRARRRRVRRPARGRRPAPPRSRSGRPGTGRRAVAFANLAENSPKLRCSDRSRTRQAVAASQKAVVPPLPSATS